MREHDVTALTAAELEAARRELAASLALARPGSPVCAPIQAHLAAIDAELAGGQPPGPAYPAPRAPGPRTAGTRVEEGCPGTQVPGHPYAWGSGIPGIPGTCRCGGSGCR
jgi:hypothetical protein